MAKRAASHIVQVKVRMREDLHRKLEREAEKRGQTLNAEILYRLGQSFEYIAELERGLGAWRQAYEDLSNRMARVENYVSVLGPIWLLAGQTGQFSGEPSAATISGIAAGQAEPRVRMTAEVPPKARLQEIIHKIRWLDLQPMDEGQRRRWRDALLEELLTIEGKRPSAISVASATVSAHFSHQMAPPSGILGSTSIRVSPTREDDKDK
jgi:hypothetical protein